MEKLTVERSVWIDASRERVWQAVTDPKQIQQWYSPTTAWELSALEVGGRLFVCDPETGAEMYAQLIELIDPPHQLVMRTEPEPPATPEVTAYTLRAENGGTRATITETGYEALPADQRQQWADAASQGYALSLEQLKGLLEGS